MERRIVSYERPENAFHPYLQEVAFPEGAAGLESLPRRLESAPQTPPADVLRLPETLVADIEAESRGRKVSSPM